MVVLPVAIAFFAGLAIGVAIAALAMGRPIRIFMTPTGLLMSVEDNGSAIGAVIGATVGAGAAAKDRRSERGEHKDDPPSSCKEIQKKYC